MLDEIMKIRFVPQENMRHIMAKYEKELDRELKLTRSKQSKKQNITKRVMKKKNSWASPPTGIIANTPLSKRHSTIDLLKIAKGIQPSNDLDQSKFAKEPKVEK